MESLLGKEKLAVSSRASGDRDERAFRWRRKSIWRRAIREMFPDVLSKAVLTHIRRHPPEFFVSDDLSWLAEPAEMVAGFDGDLFHEFENRFPSRFPFIRAFHGGRPLTWKSYRSHGLRPGNVLEQKAIAAELFGNSTALVQAMAKLEDAKGRATSYLDGSENQIYLCLDRREALRMSGHYAKYGSEYLLGIASMLGKEEFLMKRGIPTLVHANIPYFSLERDIRKDLMGTIFEDFFCRLCGAELNDYNGLNFRGCEKSQERWDFASLRDMREQAAM